MFEVPRAPGESLSLGLVLPTFPQGGTAVWSDLPGWSGRAESAGAHALWACDHLFWPGPSVECLTALALAAAGTDRCALGSGVLQLPLRSPAAVAKAAGSLQILSGNRLILGVGVGEHEGEFRAASADYGRRGRSLDEGIAALRRHWSELDGDYAQRPAPDRIPVWVGGTSARARRRAAERGDGWMPLFVPPDRLASEYELLAEEAEAAGRSGAEVVRALMVFVSVGDGDASERGARWMSSLYRLPPERFVRHLVAGEAARCADSLMRLRAEGAEHVALFVADDDPLPQLEAVMEAMAGARL